MGLLILGEEEQKAARELAAYAARPENHYIIGQSPWIPGNLQEYTRTLGTYRVVFTHTRDREGGLWRHLSISCVGNRDKYPPPILVYTIATWLGFTGGEVDEHGATIAPGEGWQMRPNPEERCVGLIERLKEEDQDGAPERLVN